MTFIVLHRSSYSSEHEMYQQINFNISCSNCIKQLRLKSKTNPFLSVIIFECKRIIFKRLCLLCRDCRLGVIVGVLAESVKGNRFDPRSGQTKRQ